MHSAILLAPVTFWVHYVILVRGRGVGWGFEKDEKIKWKQLKY